VRTPCRPRRLHLDHDASRSSPSCSEVRSVDSISGSIGNTPAAV
jgi:hypothetical protein